MDTNASRTLFTRTRETDLALNQSRKLYRSASSFLENGDICEKSPTSLSYSSFTSQISQGNISKKDKIKSKKYSENILVDGQDPQFLIKKYKILHRHTESFEQRPHAFQSLWKTGQGGPPKVPIIPYGLKIPIELKPSLPEGSNLKNFRFYLNEEFDYYSDDSDIDQSKKPIKPPVCLAYPSRNDDNYYYDYDVYDAPLEMCIDYNKTTENATTISTSEFQNVQVTEAFAQDQTSFQEFSEIKGTLNRPMCKTFTATPSKILFKGDKESISIKIQNTGKMSRRVGLISPQNPKLSVIWAADLNKRTVVPPGLDIKIILKWAGGRDGIIEVLTVLIEGDGSIVIPISISPPEYPILKVKELNVGWSLVGKKTFNSFNIDNIGGPARFWFLSIPQFESQTLSTKKIDNLSCLEFDDESVELTSFSVHPMAFSLLKNQRIRLRIAFKPIKTGPIFEKVALLCDNGEVRFLGVRGEGVTYSEQNILEIKGNFSCPPCDLPQSDSSEYSIDFGDILSEGEYRKYVRLHNKSKAPILYYWTIERVESRKESDLHHYTEGCFQNNLLLERKNADEKENKENIFSISPIEGIILGKYSVDCELHLKSPKVLGYHGAKISLHIQQLSVESIEKIRIFLKSDEGYGYGYGYRDEQQYFDNHLAKDLHEPKIGAEPSHSIEIWARVINLQVNLTPPFILATGTPLAAMQRSITITNGSKYQLRFRLPGILTSICNIVVEPEEFTIMAESIFKFNLILKFHKSGTFEGALTGEYCIDASKNNPGICECKKLGQIKIPVKLRSVGSCLELLSPIVNFGLLCHKDQKTKTIGIKNRGTEKILWRAEISQKELHDEEGSDLTLSQSVINSKGILRIWPSWGVLDPEEASGIQVYLKADIAGLFSASVEISIDGKIESVVPIWAQVQIPKIIIQKSELNLRNMVCKENSTLYPITLINPTSLIIPFKWEDLFHHLNTSHGFYYKYYGYHEDTKVNDIIITPKKCIIKPKETRQISLLFRAREVGDFNYFMSCCYMGMMEPLILKIKGNVVEGDGKDFVHEGNYVCTPHSSGASSENILREPDEIDIKSIPFIKITEDL